MNVKIVHFDPRDQKACQKAEEELTYLVSNYYRIQFVTSNPGDVIVILVQEV